MTDIRASHRFARIAPQKVRSLARSLAGKDARSAEQELGFLTSKGARLVRVVLASAIANAKENNDVDVANLKVKGVLIDEGPRMRRVSPRSRGRADVLHKRSAHLTVVLTEKHVTAVKRRTRAVPAMVTRKAEELSKEELAAATARTASRSDDAAQTRQRRAEERRGGLSRMFRRKSI